MGAPSSLRAVLAVLVAAVVAIAGTGATGESHVRVLGSENFDRLTAKGTWMLEFYAPWWVAGACALI